MEYKFFPCSIGVRCDAKDKCVIASINSKGQKRIKTNKVKNHFLFSNILFVRGILYFLYSIIAFFTTFDEVVVDDITLSEKEEKVKIKSIIFSAVIIGLCVVVWVILLGVLPAKLSFLILGYENFALLRNFVIALLKIALIYCLFILIRIVPSIVELFKFNGACNLLQQKNRQEEIKNRNNLHYPLNFLNFIVFSFLFSVFMITLIGVSVHVLANWLINLVIFLICVSLSYEFLNLLNKSTKFKKICIVTSILVVSKPNTTHIELARSAYFEQNSYREIKNKMKENEIALSLVRSEMETKLQRVNKNETSDIDWIIATVLDKNRAEIRLVRSVSEKEYRDIMKATEERAKGKPLSAIFGFVDFYGLRFCVNKKVLTPRMETELLVEDALKEIKKHKKAKVLDLCTGSGAIAVCLAKFSDAEVSAIDISKPAIELAKLNAKTLGVKVTFLQSDLFAELKKKQKYDIIVSNPPYIRSLDIEGLDVEVKNYDPRLALNGGDDGLDFYKKIIKEAPLHLNRNGVVLFEIGKGQYSQVKKIFENQGFANVKGIKDYNKIYRIVKAEWKK